jgi:hypothetical protein
VGLIVWPVLFLKLLFSKRKIDLQKLIIWSLVGILVNASYFYNYVKPDSHPTLQYVFTNPFETGRYFLTLIGAPLSHEPIMSATFGLAMVLIGIFVMAYAYKEEFLGKNIWSSLILFVVLALAATTIGRAPFGVMQAMAPRYTTITALGIIALYLMALHVSEKLPTKSTSFGAYAMLTLIFIGLIVSHGVGWYGGKYIKNSRDIGAYVLKNHELQSDEMISKYLYPDPSYVRNNVEFLMKNKLNVFNEPIMNTSSLNTIEYDTSFSISSINDEEFMQNFSPIVIDSSEIETINITGWAVDDKASTVASTVFIIIDEELEIPTYYGLDRPYVADNFNNPNFRSSGFTATFASSILDRGTHQFIVKIVTNDERGYYLSPQKFFFTLE